MCSSFLFSGSFLVSVLYSKAKLASACGGIIYFLSYVPYMYVAIREEVAHDKITAFEKCIAVCGLPPHCFQSMLKCFTNAVFCCVFPIKRIKFCAVQHESSILIICLSG